MANATESDASGDEYRTVSHPLGLHPNLEMNLLGLLWAAIVLVIVIPLLPFIALLWVISKLTKPRRGPD